MDLLPTEIVWAILEQVDVFACSFVCHYWRQIIVRYNKRIISRSIYTGILARSGNLTKLQWAISVGVSCAEAHIGAALGGHVYILEWLRINSFSFPDWPKLIVMPSKTDTFTYWNGYINTILNLINKSIQPRSQKRILEY
jgi:hypothetical protein